MSFSTAAFRPGLLAEIMLSLLRLERKQKFFPFLSYSFGIETINSSIHSRSRPSKTLPDSILKWAKRIPVFRPKRRKNPTQWGCTYLYSLYKGIPPPPGTAKPLTLIRALTGPHVQKVSRRINGVSILKGLN